MNEQVINRRELFEKAALGTTVGYAIGGGGTTAIAARDTQSKTVYPSQPNGHVIFHPSSGEGIMQGFPPPKDKLVTVDNWESTQPRTRWTHLHVRDLVPTQVIRRGAGPVNILPVRIADLNGIQVPHRTRAKVTQGRKESTAYRNLFWVDRHPAGDGFYASGHLGQVCYILPCKDLVLVKFSTWRHSDSLEDYLKNFYRDVDGLRNVGMASG